jgi:hypothetical protein
VSIYSNNLKNVKTNNIHVFEYKKIESINFTNNFTNNNIESINFTNNFTNNNFEDCFFNYDKYETKQVNVSIDVCLFYYSIYSIV